MAHDDDIAIYGLQGMSRAQEVEMLEGDYGGHEILGAQEILGALAASGAQLKGSTAFQQALARKLAQRAPVVKHVPPTKKRRWTVGFGPQSIASGATATIQCQPQCLFRGEKLICFEAGTTPTVTAIAGLFVGQKSQLPTFQNAIPSATYGAGVLDNELMMDTCDPALFITLQVVNNGSSVVTFSASLVGHAVT